MIKSRLIIFEGIASSGKTKVARDLKIEFEKKELSVAYISEEVTLMPVIDNKSVGVASDYLKKQLENLCKEETDVIIVDRFHFTHIFRTNAEIKHFREIELFLSNSFEAYVVLLTIGDDKIKDRILKAMEMRGSKWAKGRRGTIEEKVKYYMEQQNILKR